MTINVKVVQVPGSVQDLVLDDGATVGQALSTAGISPTDGQVTKLNGADTTNDATLSDNDRIIVAKGPKGARLY